MKERIGVVETSFSNKLRTVYYLSLHTYKKRTRRSLTIFFFLKKIIIIEVYIATDN